MPEVVTDLFQRQPLLQQVSGASVPQGVGTVVRQGYIQGVEPPPDRLSQSALRQRPKWGPEGEEDFTPARSGAHLPEVPEHGIPDRAAQRDKSAPSAACRA